MRDGLYKVTFHTQISSGAGVVVLQGGTIRGGDSIMYYTGTYAEDGDRFTAEVATDAHTKVPGMGSVFGIDRVHIRLAGLSKGDTAEVTGKSREAPDVRFRAILERIAD